MDKERLIKDLREEVIEGLIQCARCHFCLSACPLYKEWFTQGSFGIHQAAYYGAKWNRIDESLRDIVYACTTCGACEVACTKLSKGIPIIEYIGKARELLLEKGVGPMPDQVSALKAIYKRGNPWGEPSRSRTDWANDLDVTYISEGDRAEILYFVGCASSYDPRAQQIAKSIVGILNRIGVNFGILREEQCCGHPAFRMGERGLFDYSAESNLNLFAEHGITKVITSSPHCYHTFVNECPEAAEKIEFQHYTQFFAELIEQGRLAFSSKLDKRVTYHDPCYLGRRNEIYQEPRELIKSIPEITLIEMDETMEDSRCCGSGGGRMWFDTEEGTDLAEQRIKDALDVNAEILLTACPFCLITLDEVSKILSDKSIEVIDIAELTLIALEG